MPPSRPATRTSSCSKSRRPPSTPGSSGIPTGASSVSVGDLILVVDIGGGTTDFTLIAVTGSDGELALERVAVGEHILLGGDNMDLALARIGRSAACGEEHQARRDAAQRAVAAVPRREGEAARPGHRKRTSSRLRFSGEARAWSAARSRRSCSREDLNAILLDGFFPVVSSTDMPQRAAARRLQEIGLPYAADAADHAAPGEVPAAAGFEREHGASARPSGLAAHARAVQRRRASRRPRARSHHRRTELLAHGGRHAAVQGACRRRPDARRLARRRLLRPGAAGARRPNPRRRAADLLRRHRDAPCPRCPVCPRR